MSRLSQYFTGIAAKRLSAVETNPETSNQHEFNGSRPMVSLFGTGRSTFDCTFIYFDDDERMATAEGFLTWYDSRINQQHRSAEYRLYFNGNTAIEFARTGDLLVIGKRPDNRTPLLALIVKKDTTVERQILWLFGIEESNERFLVNSIQGDTNREIGFAERMILETLGIETETETEGVVKWADVLLDEFNLNFPTTKEFSAFARKTLPDISALDTPDETLLAWINQEEMLFRTLERHIVQIRIEKGFTDVDDFVAFSLSVQNRRKSRVGFALENHLSEVFNQHGLAYSHGQVTENKARPDFIFPGIRQYHDDAFPVNRLTMLGSKSSCKDRWRQVLSEANKIEQKHLFTLEPGISQNQTDEMKFQNLQLVLPKNLHQTYLPIQQKWLINFAEFIELILKRQQS